MNMQRDVLCLTLKVPVFHVLTNITNDNLKLHQQLGTQGSNICLLIMNLILYSLYNLTISKLYFCYRGID